MESNLKIPTELLEPMILAYSKVNLSFFMKIKDHLNTNDKSGKNYFNDPKNQEVFNVFCKCFDKYKKMPLKDTMLTINDRIEKDEEVKLYKKSIIKKMYDASPDELDGDFIQEQSLEFIKENKVYEAISGSQGDMESGNFGGLLSRIEDAVRINFDKDLGLSIKKVDTIVERIVDVTEQKTISTGFANLDGELDGGLKPKEIYTFAAIPGLGKTMLMGNMGLNAYLNGYNVMFYTFETAVERLYMRLFNNLIDASKQEFLMDQDSSISKIKSIVDTMDNNLFIKQFPANMASSDTLMAHLYDLQMYENFKPDLIIIDYLLIMSTNNKSLSQDNSYKYYKTVTEEVRNIATELDCPIITAAQINREGMSEQGGSKAINTAKELSESRGILDTVDFMATISQTAQDKRNNKWYINCVKSRNDSTGWRIQYDLDYPKMRIMEGAIMR